MFFVIPLSYENRPTISEVSIHGMLTDTTFPEMIDPLLPIYNKGPNITLSRSPYVGN
jgi:hypothetical protein